ncbi:MAG TPA: tRNA lysidine(34) synthetase TilS [Candidatus Acidoferrum sp.]|nr:tRNA lysidine(34) synthetase TilS [Candidatus Acidoferrum sp.]
MSFGGAAARMTEEVRNPSAVHASLSQRLLQRLKAQESVRPGERVGVAVSGGADSVALLLLLLELREKLGIVLSVVHFNHELRGKASDADEEFAAKLAGKHKLEFHSTSADIAKKAKNERANLEDAARRARYDYFRSLVASGTLTRIAVAHTADDQAETVLAHILRGTGLAGIGGIHPVAVPVFRPLLAIRRAELRAYLRRKKQNWREDSTNRDTTRLRARIRKKLLPLLEKQFQPAIVEHLTTLADLAREDEMYFDRLLKERTALAAEERASGSSIAVADLLGARLKGGCNTEFTEDAEKNDLLALSKRMIRGLVGRVKKHAGQLGFKHVNAVIELARTGRNGSTLMLPGGVEVRKDRGTLFFRAVPKTDAITARAANHSYAYNIDLAHGTQDLRVPELSCVFRLRVIDWPSKGEENNKREMVLDRERLRTPLVLRNWRPGDRLRPSGHQNAHKLKRLLNERHISRWEREGWPVLASGEVLVWARGFPVAADFAADEKTRTGIVIAEEHL